MTVNSEVSGGWFRTGDIPVYGKITTVGSFSTADRKGLNYPSYLAHHMHTIQGQGKEWAKLQLCHYLAS